MIAWSLLNNAPVICTLEISINDGDDVELCEGATKIAYIMQCSLDLELPAICMVEISMMSNCIREHV